MILGNPCLAALSKKNSVFYENDVVPVSLHNLHIPVKNFTVGPKALADLMKYLKLATGMVTNQFARSKSIIVDIYKKRERHIYLRSGIPNLR